MEETFAMNTAQCTRDIFLKILIMSKVIVNNFCFFNKSFGHVYINIFSFIINGRIVNFEMLKIIFRILNYCQ